MNTLGDFELNKVYCMDCLEGLKKIPDSSVDLILTDPPYSVNFDEKSKNMVELFGTNRKKQIKRDETYIELKINYKFFASEFFRILKDKTHCYIFCADKQVVEWIKSMTNVGFTYPNICVWIKNRQTFDLSCGYNYNYQTELCLYFRKGARKLNKLGLSNVFKFNTSKSLLHPAQKPLGIISFLINNSSNVDDIILDPFMGSGTTAFSCKTLKRNFIGFEISQEYVNICNKRLSQEVLA